MFGRLNKMIADRIARQGSAPRADTVTAGADGLELIADGQAIRRIPWDDIDRIVATRAEQFVADQVVLVVQTTGGGGVIVTEDMAGWAEAAAMLPRYLAGAKAYQDWVLSAALVGEGAEPVELFARHR